MSCKSKARIVRWQKLKEVDSKPISGDRSPYWNWVKNIGLSGAEGELREFAEANPDILPDMEPSETLDVDTRALMIEALKRARLSKREKSVLKCIGIQGLTEEQTAERLDISRRNVRSCLTRAQKKCEKVFAAILRHSRVIGEGRD